jgi:uncharacterized protein YbaP (TraB family)
MSRLFLLITILFLCLSTTVNGQLLWSLEHPTTGEASYLFGTIHMGDSVLCNWSTAFEEAFYDCDAVYGELDFSGDSTMVDIQSLMINEMYRSLDDVSDGLQDTISLIQGKIAEEFDVETAFGISMMKPFWGVVMVQQLRSIKETNLNDDSFMMDETEVFEEVYPPVDIVLQEMGSAQEMEIGGLEKPSDQFMLITEMSSRMSWKEYYDFVFSQKAADVNPMVATFDSIRAYYLDQDIEKIKALIEDPSIPKEFLDEFFTKRNVNMTERMIGLMKDQRVYFFAVGAGHLPGKEGLIELLREKGFTVEPVPFTFPKKR